jgi:hypothetical protein
MKRSQARRSQKLKEEKTTLEGMI